MPAKFWVRFRIPYFNYLELQWIEDNTCFAHWCGVKSNNKMSSPIVELLVFGSLCYLGCGWTFEDIEEKTAIS